MKPKYQKIIKIKRTVSDTTNTNQKFGLSVVFLRMIATKKGIRKIKMMLNVK